MKNNLAEITRNLYRVLSAEQTALGIESVQYRSAVDEKERPLLSLSDICPESGSTVPVGNNNTRLLYQTYEKCAAEKILTGEDIYAPDDMVLSWRCPLAGQAVLEIGNTVNLCEAVQVSLTGHEIRLPLLVAAVDYYWRVVQNGAASRIYHFATESGARTVWIDGVPNTRDIGGYLTESGKRVKQGIAYRGGTLDGVTESGKNRMLSALGIRTDLDLRCAGEGSAGVSSPLGEVNYRNLSGAYYCGEMIGIDYDGNRETLANELRVFANRENLPVYFHCSLGRDRTGTLALLLLALSGVAEQDIFYDYEVSFLSKTSCREEAPVPKMVDMFNGMVQYLHHYNGADDRPLSAHTEEFFSGLGLTAQEIDAIKKNLLMG